MHTFLLGTSQVFFGRIPRYNLNPLNVADTAPSMMSSNMSQSTDSVDCDCDVGTEVSLYVLAAMRYQQRILYCLPFVDYRIILPSVMDCRLIWTAG